jgi:bifunctional DNA-binding transcriptional regulator/antitoxin component of YhaV-PrlF toxin-antitoxin module
VKHLWKPTRLVRARSQTDSYRTTVPKVVTVQFGLSEGDELLWDIRVNSKGKRVILVKPNHINTKVRDSPIHKWEEKYLSSSDDSETP